MALKNEVDVVFLDAGGVLFDTFIKQYDRIRNLLTARGCPQSHIDTALVKAKAYVREFLTENSLITNWDEEEQYYKGLYGVIAKELGEMGLINELFYCTHYAVHCELFPEVKEVLETLRHRYRLGVISNALPSMDWVFDRFGIRKYFDAIILSATVKVAKPDAAIYHIALQRLQAEKAHCIFIDDKLENIEGAERVGIRGLRLDREKMNLLELLKGHGLL